MVNEGKFYPEKVALTFSGTNVNSTLTADVKSWSPSGGLSDNEAVHVFGGATIRQINAPDEIEISMDIVTDDAAWETMFLGAGTEAVNLSGTVPKNTIEGTGTYYKNTTDLNPVTIQVKFGDGTGSVRKIYHYLNAYGTSYEPSADAEGGGGEASLSYKLMPRDATGSANFYVIMASGSGYLSDTV